LAKVKETSTRYSQLGQTTRDIFEANNTYYNDGTFPPESVVPNTPPVVSEIIKTRNDLIQKEIQSGLFYGMPSP